MQENIDMWAIIVCALCIIEFIGVSIFICFQCEQEKNKIAEQHIQRGNKVFCHYIIEDKNTGEILIYGKRFRGDLNKLVYFGWFRRGCRKIFIYGIDLPINGVDCTIKFYANERECEPCSIITPAGEKLFNNNVENSF